MEPPENLLYELEKKIDDRIIILHSMIGENHFEDCDSSHDYETHSNIEFAIQILEDLRK